MVFMLQDLPDKTVFKKFKDAFPNIDPIKVEFYLHLLSLGSELLLNLDEYLKSYNLSHGRWITLILLERRENARALPSELAKQQGVSRATMTGLIKSLEKSGFVKKQSVGSDGRSVEVLLTTQGKALLKKVMPPYYQMVSKLFCKNSKIELKNGLALLKKTRTNFLHNKETL